MCLDRGVVRDGMALAFHQMKRAMIAIFVILTECVSPPHDFPRYNEVRGVPLLELGARECGHAQHVASLTVLVETFEGAAKHAALRVRAHWVAVLVGIQGVNCGAGPGAASGAGNEVSVPDPCYTALHGRHAISARSERTVSCQAVRWCSAVLQRWRGGAQLHADIGTLQRCRRACPRCQCLPLRRRPRASGE